MTSHSDLTPLADIRDRTRLARQCVTTDLHLGLTAVPLRRALTSSEAQSLPAAVPAERTPSAIAFERVEVRERPRESPQEVQVAVGGIPPRRERFDVADLVTRQDRAEALEKLRELHERACPHCTTATGHTHLVFGEGDPESQLMFVGEAPGETEDRVGRPFVGPAGQKLDEMVRAMGLRREDVYIANVLKSRPPENRTPLQSEVDACGPYLVDQIRIIRPRVLVTLGGPATKLLLATELGITRLRGIWASFRGEDIEIPVMPTFHPAYLLRNYTAETRRQVWSDLQAVLAKLSSPGEDSR